MNIDDWYFKNKQIFQIFQEPDGIVIVKPDG